MRSKTNTAVIDNPETLSVFSISMKPSERSKQVAARLVEYVGKLGDRHIGIMQTGSGKWRGIIVMSKYNTIQTEIMNTAKDAAKRLEGMLSILVRDVEKAKCA